MSMLRQFVLRFLRGWMRDEIPRHSAVIAYYGLFSLPALFLVVLSVPTFFMGDGTSSQNVFQQISLYVNEETVRFLQHMFESATTSPRSLPVRTVSVLFLLFSAVNVIHEVRRALNDVLSIKEHKRNWKITMWGYVISFLLLLFIALLVTVSIVANTILTMIENQAEVFFPHPMGILSFTSHLMTYSVLTILFFFLYVFLPNRRQHLLASLLCAAIASALFIGGTMLLSAFLAHIPIGQEYGVAATLLVVLLWISFSSIIFLTGAECMDTYNSLEEKHR